VSELFVTLLGVQFLYKYVCTLRVENFPILKHFGLQMNTRAVTVVMLLFINSEEHNIVGLYNNKTDSGNGI
jgi:hypothetical protein